MGVEEQPAHSIAPKPTRTYIVKESSDRKRSDQSFSPFRTNLLNDDTRCSPLRTAVMQGDAVWRHPHYLEAPSADDATVRGDVNARYVSDMGEIWPEALAS